MLFEDKVSKPFADKVNAIAKKLGMKPDFIMAVIGFESAMTFSPSKKNPNSSATGLIQFMKKTAEGLGTTTAALAAMSDIQQLDYVEKYFANVIASKGPLLNLVDTYLAVFYPNAIGKPLTFAFDDSIAKVNPAFMNDETGFMTKQDIVDTITDWVKQRGGIIENIQKANPVFNGITIAGVAVMASYLIAKYCNVHSFFG